MPLIRSANFNLFVEIVVRIILMSAFCYMESMQPFVRVIQRAELELHFMYPHMDSYMESMQPFVRVIQRAELESHFMYPHMDSYVTGAMLWTIVLAVPCVLSMLAWAVCNDCNDAFEILLSWSLALGINGVLTDMVKLMAGRPRPDFFYRCFPDGVETKYLQCTGDPTEIMEGRKSFPSGHSSLSFCSLGVASAWLCGRLGVLSRRRGSGLRVIGCLMPLVLAAAIALSRSCDYHHHWQDILVGSLLGYSVAIFCYRQYYNPLSSDLAGIPYIVSCVNSAKFFNGKPDSPVKDVKEESTPLLNGKKDDKWI